MTRTRAQIFRFDDGDERIAVQTAEMGDGSYCAFQIEPMTGPLGFGFSTIGAIADLFQKMPAAASEREERDEQAARFDHQQDLRKNWTPQMRADDMLAIHQAERGR
jgi:hypothetical protein